MRAQRRALVCTALQVPTATALHADPRARQARGCAPRLPRHAHWRNNRVRRRRGCNANRLALPHAALRRGVASASGDAQRPARVIVRRASVFSGA